ncbi:MAG TPA: hypothetical protein VGM98_10540 [Schlesneria sp.]|jgi:anti-sigma-K factor RskA
MSVDNNDRDWLAMQYVLGELSDVERNAFEERLLTDLQLCEAVTAASRLMLTAREVLATDAAAVFIRHQSNQRTSGRSWSAVVATIAAMAMALLLVVRIPTNSRVANDSPHAAELVSLWRSGSDASDDDSDDLDDAMDNAADVAVPSWMLAAVSIEAGRPINAPSDQVQEN